MHCLFFFFGQGTYGQGGGDFVPYLNMTALILESSNKIGGCGLQAPICIKVTEPSEQLLLQGTKMIKN